MINQIIAWVYFVPFGYLDQAVHHAAGIGSAHSIGKKEILAADNKRLYTSLGPIVADLKSAIQKIPTKKNLLSQHISNRNTERTPFKTRSTRIRTSCYNNA